MSSKFVKNVQKTVQKTAQKTFKTVKTNKYILYILLILAILNVLVLLSNKNFSSLTVFALSGLLTCYFTKNMVIILTISIISSIFLHISSKTIETMKNKKNKKKKDEKKDEKKNKKDAMTNVLDNDTRDDSDETGSDSDEDDENDSYDDEDTAGEKKGGINHQKTVEDSYNNIHSILGNKNFQKMTTDTTKLLDQQNSLVESLKSMTPIMNQERQFLMVLVVIN